MVDIGSPVRASECPKIYFNSVLHLLKYCGILIYADAVKICGKFWDTQYIQLYFY